MGTPGRARATVALCALLLAGCSGGEEDAPSPGVPVDDAATTNDTASATDTTDTPDDTLATKAPAAGEPTTSPTQTTQTGEPAAAPDSLEVEVVLDGLSLPWDVQLLPDGTALVTERGGRLLAVDDPTGAAEAREVSMDVSTLFVGSEAGLMGMAVSPDFAQDRSIFLCHAAQPTGERPDVRVTRWVLDKQVTSATQDAVVVDGIPLTSGRHSGCRLLFRPDGTLLVGTGDAADEANPQSLDSLGGKVLAVTRDGDPTDPDGHVPGGDPRILTYGHRNVQGLALRPGGDEVWSVEHGPDVDDEVNLLVPGANYGWDPGPGYDESVPMTDTTTFPRAVEAVWSSGRPTHATSGAVFLQGEQWGAWDGALAVAELKGSGVTVLTLDGDEVTGAVRPEELDGTFGRLRSLTLDDDGALWVTSSNGEDDVLLRVTPAG
jgi:aldose sugar dehydrogenase